MRRFVASFLVFATACSGGPEIGARSAELVVCGRDEVFILDFSDPASPRKVWSWRAAERPEIPEELRPKFRTTDECKPVDGGARILITSSGGAAALVERSSGRALWWAAALNAHSAELLPGGRVAVASSYHKDGNRILLFDLATPMTPLAHDEFLGAHGFVWDEPRRLLWALGDRELRSYRLKESSLERVETFPLPDAGGHDLRPVPGTSRLILTTNPSVWHFDRDRKVFEIPEGFPEMDQVKSVDLHPRTGRVAWVRAEESWWAFRVRLLRPEDEIILPDERIYKARWLMR